jgi:hypothetical protein
MVIVIVDALLGLLLGTAAIGIPRLIALRKNHPEDETDSLAYMKATGRSAQVIAEDNRAFQQENEAGPQQEGGSDGPPSDGADSRQTSDRDGNS